MPFRLHVLERTNRPLESFNPTARLNQFERMVPVLWTFENQVRQGPPVQVIQVEMAVHTWAATVGDNRS